MSTENLASLENVINPKSLERQIKIIEGRLSELQSETAALEKRREACYILLGHPLPPFGVAVEAAAAPVTAKKISRGKKKESTEVTESEVVDSDTPEERSIIRASDLQ